MRITGISYLIMSNLTQNANAADAGDDVQNKTTVHKAELFEWQPGKKGLNVKASWMREIMRANGVEEKEVEYKLLDMTWQMLAKAIAKVVYERDIDDAKADELGKLLQRDNGGCDIPAKVLMGLPPLTGGEKVQSRINYNVADQFNVYLGKVESRGKSVQWGRFPPKLPLNISVDFAKTVNGISAQAVEQPKQPEPVYENVLVVTAPVEPKAVSAAVQSSTGTKYYKVQVAVYNHGAMARAIKLSDRLDQLLKEYPSLLKNEVLDTCIQQNADGLWRVQAGAFIHKEHAVGMRDYLMKRFMELKDEPELHELGTPIIKYEE